MSYVYTTWVSALSTELIIGSTDTNFLAILPSCIDYAEQRIYRDLDLLSTVVTDASANLAANTRSFVLPTATGTFVVVNGLNVITPVGTTPANGTRNQLVAVSRDYLDLAWPSAAGAGVPLYFAMLTQATALLGPWPDATYNIEVVGTQRPTPLSSGNASTFLATNLPDLFFAASMVFMSGYTKNFGAQSDDPRQALSWEAQYTTLKQSAETEEARKRFAGSSWTSLSVPPQAQPARS